MLTDPNPTPDESLTQREARALLEVVLDRMSLELRSVFVLVELEELEVQAVAELQNSPVGTASSRLRRARAEFSAHAKRPRIELSSRERRR
jgi:RNA polymerase sigma-70 factor (ECF subfamily)